MAQLSGGQIVGELLFIRFGKSDRLRLHSFHPLSNTYWQIMLGGTAVPSEDGFIRSVGRITMTIVMAVGDFSLFGFRMVRWLFTRRQRSSVLISNMHAIGVESLPVVLITGLFIGMVLSVQTYDQFKALRMESRLGAVINVSLVGCDHARRSGGQFDGCRIGTHARH